MHQTVRATTSYTARTAAGSVRARVAGLLVRGNAYRQRPARYERPVIQDPGRSAYLIGPFDLACMVAAAEEIITAREAASPAIPQEPTPPAAPPPFTEAFHAATAAATAGFQQSIAPIRTPAADDPPGGIIDVEGTAVVDHTSLREMWRQQVRLQQAFIESLRRHRDSRQ